MESITQMEKKKLIEGYNALVEDFLKLGIGTMPMFDEQCPIPLEVLFFFQGIVASKLISHTHMMNDFLEKGGDEVGHLSIV
jgi:hypothetical protein